MTYEPIADLTDCVYCGAPYTRTHLEGNTIAFEHPTRPQKYRKCWLSGENLVTQREKEKHNRMHDDLRAARAAAQEAKK